MSEFNARRRKQLEAEAVDKRRQDTNRRVIAEMKQQQPATASAPNLADRRDRDDLISRIERMNRSVERLTALMAELRGEVENEHNG